MRVQNKVYGALGLRVEKDSVNWHVTARGRFDIILLNYIMVVLFSCYGEVK